ncbi:Calcipressin [Cylindrobasidium torrendii FP15055 ss-10]|uniref:Calcipressin n=1 Tax=Cylindrobasidium torrendii FP15055 ss-10 TaxID=1314674 RepID=A0A0D7BF04_9AGAR|nr:Calcipressin [Cylindrobasidium torrendii FP15055 ss-10]
MAIVTSHPASSAGSSRSASPTTDTDTTTNTLAVTSLPKTFFHPNILAVLRDHLEAFGEINQWVPLPTFGRIIVVFVHNSVAETAKRECDPIILRGSVHDSAQTVLRVYRADPNPLVTAFGAVVPQAAYLRPPEIEKNFLISPPGSPPVGWEHIREDPPNATPLADDLIAALNLLKLQERGPSVEVLLDPEEGGVGVFVEDCDRHVFDPSADSDDEHSWVYGQTGPRTPYEKTVPIPTAMPPMRAW